MLTQGVSGADSTLQVSETILRNLRVLATDQVTSQVVVDGQMQPRVSTTVTLEVTPRIAEKVTVAQTLGTISFSLRPLADSGNELEKAIAAGTVKLPDNATPEQEEKFLKAAVEQPTDGKTSFVTGGDVSRFQRSSVPPKTASTTPVYTGPTVRVRRGPTTTDTPVGRPGTATVLVNNSATTAGSTASSQALPTVPAKSGT
jgi:pilus assembly protein CpaB